MTQHLIHIFDLDDTLINTKDAYFSSYYDALKTIDLSTEQSDALLQNLLPIFGSSGYSAVFEAILNITNKRLDMKHQLSQHFEQHFWSRLAVYQNGIEYLTFLQKQDRVIALCSNGNGEIQRRKLKQLSLIDFFAEKNIRISAERKFERPKPAADMLQSIINANNGSNDTACFYGNSSGDYLAAKNCSIYFLLFTQRADQLFEQNFLSDYQNWQKFSDWQELLDLNN